MSWHCHTMKLIPIMTILCDIMRNNQMVFSIICSLYVIPDHASTTPTESIR
ncbi:MAG: hypothetical protein HKN34_06345 [Gammaproteobacteria bacterium]|nr:hypothetical protein [Gammaproteobacteria bacterium]